MADPGLDAIRAKYAQRRLDRPDLDAPGQSGSYLDYAEDAEVGEYLCSRDGHRQPIVSNFCSRCGHRFCPECGADAGPIYVDYQNHLATHGGGTASG